MPRRTGPCALRQLEWHDHCSATAMDRFIRAAHLPLIAWLVLPAGGCHREARHAAPHPTTHAAHAARPAGHTAAPSASSPDNTSPLPETVSNALADTADAFRPAMEAVASNIANAQTIGFKRLLVTFHSFHPPVVPDTTTANAPEAIQTHRTDRQPWIDAPQWIVTRDFSSGECVHTGGSLDLAISGPGFFEIEDADGSLTYTRDGKFQFATDGSHLVTVDGLRLRGGISDLPPGTTSIHIGSDGHFQARGTYGTHTGQFRLSRFPQPSQLEATHGTRFQATPGSGDAIETMPGTDGAGELLQGFLEMSNANIDIEIATLQQIYHTFQRVSASRH